MPRLQNVFGPGQRIVYKASEGVGVRPIHFTARNECERHPSPMLEGFTLISAMRLKRGNLQHSGEFL